MCGLVSLQASPLTSKQIENTWQTMLQSAPKNETFIQQVTTREEVSDVFVVLQINKNINQVWSEVVAFGTYASKINELDEVDIYEKKDEIVKATFTFSKFFLSFNNSFIHTLDAKNHSLTWELDTSRDYEMLNLSYGIWRFEKINEKKTRAYYQNSVSYLSWIPSMVVEYALETGSKNSTLWLAK
mgnify:CR=1 FL=1